MNIYLTFVNYFAVINIFFNNIFFNANNQYKRKEDKWISPSVATHDKTGYD